MRNVQKTILSANDDVSRTGSAINTGQWVSASFQPVFGDTDAAGTVKIQGSNDFFPAGTLGPEVPTNWADIPNATSTITAGVGPMIVIPNMAFQFVRAVFTSTAPGATTVRVLANGLSI